MKQKYLLLFLTIFFGLKSFSQTTLTAGDILIIDVQADTPDRFKFITLVDLEAGTQIKFTDDGWLGSSFRGNEGRVEYTAPSLITRGTTIEYTSGDSGAFVEVSGGLGLSGAGDQLIAYQGTEGAPTFIFAVQTNSTQWQTGSNDANQSDLPTGLTNDVNAVAAGAGAGAEEEFDNVYYSGVMTGTGKEISEAVGNSANWSGANAIGYVSPNITLVDVTWNGTTSSDWGTDTNWSSSHVPEKYDNVVIPSSGVTNYPTVSSTPGDVYKITINSGASLIANASISDDVTYIRSLGTTNWYLVSSPVSGEDMTDMRANNSFKTNGSSEISFAPYDNSQAVANDRWAYFSNTATDALVNGKGYSASLSAAGNISFTGSVNSGDVMIALTQGGGSGTNFNLLGNPYTAFVNSATFLTAESGDLASETIYVWNQATSSYETKVTADAFKIAPGQGFFVEANSTNNVSFTGAMQSHEASDTFQRSSRPEVQLYVNDGSNSRYAKLYYINGTTTGFDNGYDGKLFNGLTNSFAVYTHLLSDSQGDNYQVQSLPNSDIETMVVPVGLIAESNKEITFSVNTKNLPQGVNVYLEDRLNNTFVNLSEDDHTITTKSAVNGIGQYYLHTTSARLSNDDIAQNIANVSIYRSANNEITVAGLQSEAKVKVFSLLGEELVNTDINSNGLSKIALPNLSTGVYVVKLNSVLGNITKKIILE
ncbi:T9SS type A sorting domain-containing protein [Tenacibaculum sp. 190524A05c]|uniref:T9SS type A sorting domain-containing protein n=1 Tax=Tenacibaculum platacis TaxID=3137852 RepID=UPI0032B146B0